LFKVKLRLIKLIALKTVASCAIKCRDRLQKAETLSTANLGANSKTQVKAAKLKTEILRVWFQPRKALFN